MNAPTETLSVIVEREIAQPPEKIWRALTQPHLIAEWLMRTDFRPDVGAAFTMSGDWGSVDCRVLTVEPHRTLAYTWAAFGLESVVTFTLVPTAGGTRLRMEQAGFRGDQPQFFEGAKASWPAFIDRLDDVLGRMS